MEASANAGKWLDPQNFIIRNTKFERSKKIVLKDVIQKANQQKLFQDCSVFATKNTVLSFDELKEIIENAGGECLTISQEPSFKNPKNLFLCYNDEDKQDVEEINKKYK